MGEGIRKTTRVRITDITEEDESVLKLMHLMDTYQSTEDILLMLIVAFKPELK